MLGSVEAVVLFGWSRTLPAARSPEPSVDDFDEVRDRAHGVVDVGIFVHEYLLVFQRFHKTLADRIVRRRSRLAHARNDAVRGQFGCVL